MSAAACKKFRRRAKLDPKARRNWVSRGVVRTAKTVEKKKGKK